MQSNTFLVQKNIAPALLFHYTLGPSQNSMLYVFCDSFDLCLLFGKKIPLRYCPKGSQPGLRSCEQGKSIISRL
jgi:hypothetical protein